MCIGKEKEMRQLRERGVYKAPDGKELIACAGILGYYLLYNLTKGTNGIPAYVIDASGHIISVNQPTQWKADDLRDTGQTFLEMFLTPRFVREWCESARADTRHATRSMQA